MTGITLSIDTAQNRCTKKGAIQRPGYELIFEEELKQWFVFTHGTFNQHK
jgi:hypothetical protein